jgi:hypothetical protein
VELANHFLDESGLNMVLRDNKLFVVRHRDLEAVEGQPSPTVKDLAKVSRALMSAEASKRMEVAAALLPAIYAQLREHLEDGEASSNWMSRVKDFAKSYCSVLGGRDLALDDIIGAVNAYYIDQIGHNSALKSSNIAAAALTAVLMLAPTIGKNLPTLVDAIKEGQYRDAIMPALSILAISAMTLNPTAAALGWDRTSAIASATGNLLMMANLPEIVHHAYDWGKLRNANPDPDARPFEKYARTHGLVDQGLHTTLDFLHEVGAQAGFLALNVKNAIGAEDSARNPVVFPILATLLGSFAVDTVRGDQPFSEFALGREALTEDIANSGESLGARGHAVMLALQHKIAEAYTPEYGGLIDPLLEASVARHVTRQFGGNTLPDTTEKAFLNGLLTKFVAGREARDGMQVAIDRIYRFHSFDPAQYASGDPTVGEILRFIQTQRNKDKGLLRAERGVAQADHVYRGIIAHAIKCLAFAELEHSATPKVEAASEA